MQVGFSTNKLKKAFEQKSNATKSWGDKVARKYIQRIEALYAAETFDDIQLIQAFKAHELRGNRKGQWSITLTRRSRLIVLVSEDLRSVEVMEVSQHYDD